MAIIQENNATLSVTSAEQKSKPIEIEVTPLKNETVKKETDYLFKLFQDIEQSKRLESFNLKKVFHKIDLKVHPDKGGDPAIFREINDIKTAVMPVYEKGELSDYREKHDFSMQLDSLLAKGYLSLVHELIEIVLIKHPDLNEWDLRNPVQYKVKNSYEHYADNPCESRHYHFFEAKSNKYENLNEKFKGMTGDFLKSKILDELKDELQNKNTLKSLAEFKEKYMNTDEYRIIKTSQGISGFWGRETSSLKALHEMFEEQETSISKNSNQFSR